jgi:predicted GIY-YIG superfamily endonuclease
MTTSEAAAARASEIVRTRSDRLLGQADFNFAIRGEAKELLFVRRHFCGELLPKIMECSTLGITDDRSIDRRTIDRRTLDHRNDVNTGCTRDYRVHHLVYDQTFKLVDHAIARDNSIKGWRQREKTGLIESESLAWQHRCESCFDHKRRFRCAEDEKFFVADRETEKRRSNDRLLAWK